MFLYPQHQSPPTSHSRGSPAPSVISCASPLSPQLSGLQLIALIDCTLQGSSGYRQAGPPVSTLLLPALTHAPSFSGAAPSAWAATPSAQALPSLTVPAPGAASLPLGTAAIRRCPAPLGLQLVKNPPATQETWVGSLGWDDPWRREQLPTPISWPGESHGVAESQTRLSDFHMSHLLHETTGLRVRVMSLSVTPGSPRPGSEFNSWAVNEQLPRWLDGKGPTCQCRRCRRLRFDPWVRKIPWRKAWQPTPVFLPGDSHGQRRQVGCSPQGRIRAGHD